MLKLFASVALIIGIVAVVSKPAPPEVLDTHTGQWEQQSHHYDPKEDPCYLEDGEQGPPCRDFIPPLS